MTLTTLTLDRVIRHTVVHDSSSSIYVSNFIENGKPYLGLDGRMDIPTDGHFRPPLMLLLRLGRSWPKDAKSVCPVCLFHAIAPAVSQWGQDAHVLTQPANALLATRRERWIHESHNHALLARVIRKMRLNLLQLYYTVNVIFRPYGRKLSLKFRYFPSIRTEI